MLSTIIAHATGLVGRSLPTLLAMQDAAQAPARGSQSSGGGGGGGGGPGGALGGMLIPLLMIGFLYFFMFRPMSKQKKEQETLNKSLQKGDRVVTSAGIVGTITGMEDQFITLEISEKVRVKFLRESVTRKLDDASLAAMAAKKDKPTASATTTPADAKK